MNCDSEDFYDLVYKYLDLWPSEIDVSQIFVEGEQSPFAELILAHDNVESSLYKIDNYKLWVLDWAVFKYFNALARKKEISTLSKKKLNLRDIEVIYLADIKSWRREHFSARNKS